MLSVDRNHRYETRLRMPQLLCLRMKAFSVDRQAARAVPVEVVAAKDESVAH